MGPAGCLLSCRSLQEFPMVLAAASGVLDATAQPRSRIGAKGATVAPQPAHKTLTKLSQSAPQRARFGRDLPDSSKALPPWRASEVGSSPFNVVSSFFCGWPLEKNEQTNSLFAHVPIFAGECSENEAPIPGRVWRLGVNDESSDRPQDSFFPAQ